MKREINLKTIILTSIFTVVLLLIGATKSSATLQSNPTTHNSPAEKAGATWITEIRQMEAKGQTMGLSEEIGDDLVETTPNNNIDVHMMTSTEYGAVAILSISGFGNPKPIRTSTIKSTTGNVTGVYFNNEMIVATEGMNDYIGKNKKYFTKYSTTVWKDGAFHVGDALGYWQWSLTPGCYRMDNVEDKTEQSFPFHSGSIQGGSLLSTSGYTGAYLKRNNESIFDGKFFGSNWNTTRLMTRGVAV